MTDGELDRKIHDERQRYLGKPEDFAVNQSFSYFQQVLAEAKKDFPFKIYWDNKENGNSFSLYSKKEIAEKGGDNVFNLSSFEEMFDALNEISEWFLKWFGNSGNATSSAPNL